MSDFDEAILKEFQLEAAEMFEEAEDALLNIDRGEPFNDNYNRIFRAFHSLKGAAGMFGIDSLQSHMHSLENLFETKKSEESLSKQEVDYFLSGIDAAKAILNGEESNFIHNSNDETVEIKIDVSQEIHTVDTPTPQTEQKEISSTPKMDISKNEEYSIFVCDDEPDILEILQNILEEDNYKVKTFASVSALLETLTKTTPDLILSDMKMPEMTGIDLAKEMNNKQYGVPLIFISGMLTKDIVLEVLQFGNYSFIEKPFNKITLLSMCRDTIKKTRATKLLLRSIEYIMLQFSSLDEFLKKEGKDVLRDSLKKELKQILDQKAILIKDCNIK